MAESFTDQLISRRRAMGSSSTPTPRTPKQQVEDVIAGQTLSELGRAKTAADTTAVIEKYQAGKPTEFERLTENADPTLIDMARRKKLGIGENVEADISNWKRMMSGNPPGTPEYEYGKRKIAELNEVDPIEGEERHKASLRSRAISGMTPEIRTAAADTLGMYSTLEEAARPKTLWEKQLELGAPTKADSTLAAQKALGIAPPTVTPTQTSKLITEMDALDATDPNYDRNVEAYEKDLGIGNIGEDHEKAVKSLRDARNFLTSIGKSSDLQSLMTASMMQNMDPESDMYSNFESMMGTGSATPEEKNALKDEAKKYISLLEGKVASTERKRNQQTVRKLNKRTNVKVGDVHHDPTTGQWFKYDEMNGKKKWYLMKSK